MSVITTNRRKFLAATLASVSSMSLINSSYAAKEKLPPVRTITKGPKHHWFGYYDKWEFDPTDRYVLGMEVNFEHRSPKSNDVIKMGMVDLQDNDRWIEFGESSAWGWQQGCMLQWVPNTKSTVIWNARHKDSYVCHILDVKTKKRRTISSPIYTLSPDGETAVTADFRRINDLRPGYGYSGFADPHQDELTPKDSGVFRVNLKTGKTDLILSLADVVKFGQKSADMRGAKHYFNHLLFNPDGSRFIVLHRWRPDGGKKGFKTRMLTMTPEGKDLCVVDPSGHTSHFIWRDPKHILAWTKPKGKKAAFYLFKDQSSEVEIIGDGIMTRNGHCTYLPGNQWILNDTYPDSKRLQHPYLYHVKSKRRVPIGHFHLPKEYRGEWRCDTHPRFSRDGSKIVIDSPHTGQGRQLHLIDVSDIID